MTRKPRKSRADLLDLDQDHIFASVLDSVNHGIIVSDGNGTVRYVNQPAKALSGRDGKECSGLPVGDFLKLLDCETRTPIKIPSPRSLQKDRAPRRYFRCALLTPTEKEALVDAIFSPLTNGDDKITGTVIILHDISSAVARERLILDQKMIESVAVLAGNMARDFGNSLGVISGHASAIADNLLPNTRAHEEALRILEASQSAGDLTKRLLSIASAGNIDTTTKIERIHLGEILGDAISLTQSTLARDTISFNLRNLAMMSAVETDASQLLDCLVNLFRNAMEAMPDGGTITIDAVAQARNKRDFIVLRIRDTGVGIPKEHMPRIFEPFFSTKNSASAIGLGLTVVKTAVERWGGDIKIRSRPGQGTSTRVWIPKAKTLTPDSSARTDKQGGETILLADDKPELLKDLRLLLEEAGYRVRLANGGHECVALYRKHAEEIALSIIDVVMPEKDGKSVLQDILKIDPTASVVLTSGFSRDYVRGYLKRGAWGFIQKPFENSQLLALVRKTLKKTDAQQTTQSRTVNGD